jgi:hypothetical protein
MDGAGLSRAPARPVMRSIPAPTPSGELAGSEATTAAANVALTVHKPCFSCPENQPWCHCTTCARGAGIIEFRGRDTTMEDGAQLRASAGGC